MSPEAGRKPAAPLDAALRPFRQLGIRPRLLLVLSFLALFGVGIATVFHLSSLADFAVGSMAQDARQISQQATLLVDRALLAHPGKRPESVIHDDRNLRAFLAASIGPYPYVQYIAVMDTTGTVLAHTTAAFIGRPLPPAPGVSELLRQNALDKLISLQRNEDYELVQPIMRGDEPIGSIRIGLSSSFVRAALVPPFRKSLLLALVALVLAGVIALVLADLTTRPLHALLGALEKVGRGELVEKFEPVAADEDVMRLFTSFNVMNEKVAEERSLIQSRNQQLAAIVDGLEDGVLLVEKGGRIAHANGIACRVIGREEAAIVGHDIAQALGPDHPLTELWREAMTQSDARERAEVRFDTDARGDRYLLLAYPVPHGKETQGVVLTLRNSDSIRKLTSLLDESHRMIAWGQVALGVAHEIKNPLQAMNLHLDLARERLAREPESRDLAGPLRNLGVVGEQIHRLDDVVNGFLRFARMTHAQREPLHLNQILSEVVGLLAGEAEKNGTEIRFTPRPGLPTPWGDRSLLYQAFLNLVQNAVQAGPHKGPIDVRVEEGPNRMLVIVVEDHGKGIPRKEHAKVFDLFYTTRPEGSGIGLPIVQRALQLHGGQVTIESEEGKGTVASAYLPLNVPLDSQLAGHAAGAIRGRAR